jgi:hypothetical protein
VSATEAGLERLPATKKIALIGSAPSSVGAAPYADRSWTIWGCSPGAAGKVQRADQWFELHPLNRPDILPDYMAWMAQINVPVALIQPDPRIPKGFAYPKDEMLAKYGPWFFTSSVAWMLALAIEQQPAEIGLWGIDMAANEEYAAQRPGCHFFIREALKLGIKVYVADQSDLCSPPALYGFEMASPMWQKLDIREKEMVARVAEATAKYEAARNEFNFVNGALDDLRYIKRTWVQ